MFSYKTLILLVLFAVFSFCKKHSALPELGMGNDFSSESGVQLVKVDSFNVTSVNHLRTYPGIRLDLLTQYGVIFKKINVYKNLSAVYTATVAYNKYHSDFVTSGEKVTFQYTIVDAENRESKKSIPYVITVP